MKHREIRSRPTEMDGVLVHEEHAIAGADRVRAQRAGAERIPFPSSRIVESIAGLVDELG